jgi:hypothetical protein
MIPKRIMVVFTEKIRIIAPKSQMPTSRPIKTIINEKLSAYSILD